MQNPIASRIAFALLSTALCSGAHALSPRTYLSASGSDSNPCTEALPCRLLPAALNEVMDGGEVWMVDSANFNTGTVEVTKSVSILAIPGVVGSVVQGLGDGPAIRIAAAGVKVSLRNLVIVPVSPSASGPISPPPNGLGAGIYMSNGESLTIQDTLVAEMRYFGIEVKGPIRVRILDSVIRDMGFSGVVLRDGVSAEIHNSRFIGNFVQGVTFGAGFASTPTTLAVSDSYFSGSGTAIQATQGTSSATRLMAIRTTASGNGTAFACSGVAASCTVGYSVASGNGIGFKQDNGSTFRSMGNNIVTDSFTADVDGTVTPLPGS